MRVDQFVPEVALFGPGLFFYLFIGIIDGPKVFYIFEKIEKGKQNPAFADVVKAIVNRFIGGNIAFFIKK
jgi:hypothetical protein